jgi:tetraacyldisaccharide 4'-kinase
MISDFFSKVYGKIVKYRNRRYDREENLSKKISLPVISVGNLSVGGTGKTPFVEMLVRILISMGKQPAIIGRGYKRKSKGEVIICDGKKLLATAWEGGDELYLLARKLLVPTIAHESKVEAALSAERRFDIDCIVVDDGFQHRALRRNLDIVLIDKETIEKPFLLPKGMLREPLESLKRANVICLTGGAKITDELKQHTNFDTVFIKVKVLNGEPYILGNTQDTYSFDKIKQQNIIAIAGIAKPFRFYEMVQSLGFHLVNHLNFSDHHYYDRNDIEKIRRFAQENKSKYIAVTEKDAVKLLEFTERFKHYGLDLLVFPISMKIIDGRETFINLLKLTIG